MLNFCSDDHLNRQPVFIEEQLRELACVCVKTMVGGAPVTQDWANKIGADIYAENAADAVTKLKALF